MFALEWNPPILTCTSVPILTCLLLFQKTGNNWNGKPLVIYIALDELRYPPQREPVMKHCNRYRMSVVHSQISYLNTLDPPDGSRFEIMVLTGCKLGCMTPQIWLFNLIVMRVMKKLEFLLRPSMKINKKIPRVA
uniref:Uncharacterized protein n=1 Tax=Tanacetum cinerariifolium TaxID=118510 RepID=A0A6L2KB97_TANCI|nr:hypothetical protein [Tanacetum cinerariifolium]